MKSICARINFVLWPALLLAAVPFYLGLYGYAAIFFLITAVGRVLTFSATEEATDESN